MQLKKLHKIGYELIITVDCGISGIEEIDLANSLGMKVIVTDHHEPLDILPNAVAVVDAKRKDNQ
jgi:single-stranded-DNA-specific exonuclease